MDYLPKFDPDLFAQFAAQIRKDTDDWQVIEIGLTGSHEPSYIARKVCEHFKDKEGVTIIVNSKAILTLVKLGRSANLQAVALRVRAKMPPDSCSVVATGVTGDGLARLQLHVHETGLFIPGSGADSNNDKDSLFNERMEREECIALIVDDDPVTRKLVGGMLQSRARIIEQSGGDKVVDLYLEYLPDIVFLDLHLPRHSGLEILEEILSFDDTAYVIIITAQGGRENVINARTSGAKGFLMKPLEARKIHEAYKKCPSVMARE